MSAMRIAPSDHVIGPDSTQDHLPKDADINIALMIGYAGTERFTVVRNLNRKRSHEGEGRRRNKCANYVGQRRKEKLGEGR